MPLSIKVNLRVTGHCNQGGRKYMEDMFSVAYQQTSDDKDLEYAFFGIFDGHGGGEAASFAKEHLMDLIVKQKNFWSDKDEDVLRAIKDGYINTHYAMWRELDKWPRTASGLPSTAGTTASIAFIRKGKIYIGHVGDSGIILGYEEKGSPQWKAKSLTQDHKPEAMTELIRIKESGGKVVKKSGVPRVVWNRPRIGHKGPVRRSTHIDEIPFLAVARSLGDLWSYNSELDTFVVSPEPDVKVFTIDVSTHRCLIFGTDGLWNMLSPDVAVSIVQTAEEHNEKHFIASQQAGNATDSQMWINPSKSLVDKALERWLSTRLRADNTSVVTLMLDPPGPSRGEVLLNRKKEKILLSPKNLPPSSPILTSPIIRTNSTTTITSSPGSKLNSTYIKSPSLLLQNSVPKINCLNNNNVNNEAVSNLTDKFTNVSSNIDNLKEKYNDKLLAARNIFIAKKCTSNDDNGDNDKLKNNLISQDKSIKTSPTVCTANNNINSCNNVSVSNSVEFIQVAEVSSTNLINGDNNNERYKVKNNNNTKIDKANEIEIFPVVTKSPILNSINDNKKSNVISVLSPIRNSLPPMNTIVDLNCNNEGSRNIESGSEDTLMTLEEAGRSLTGLYIMDVANFNRLKKSKKVPKTSENCRTTNDDQINPEEKKQILPPLSPTTPEKNISDNSKVMSVSSTSLIHLQDESVNSSYDSCSKDNSLKVKSDSNKSEGNDVLIKKRNYDSSFDAKDKTLSCDEPSLKRRTRSEDRKCPTNENEPINQEKDELVGLESPQQTPKQLESLFMWPSNCIVTSKSSNNVNGGSNSPTKLSSSGNSFQRRNLEKKINSVKTIRRPSINGGSRVQLRKSFSVRDWEHSKSNRRYPDTAKSKLNRSVSSDSLIKSSSHSVDNQRWLRSDTVAASTIKTLRSRNVDVPLTPKIALQHSIMKQPRTSLSNKMTKVKTKQSNSASTSLNKIKKNQNNLNNSIQANNSDIKKVKANSFNPNARSLDTRSRLKRLK